MKFILIYFLICWLPISLVGQDLLEQLSRKELKRYRKVTRQAYHAPSAITTHLPSLAHHLTRDAKTDLDKIRAFYIWIANNISYDMRSYLDGDYPSQDLDKTLKTRTALCDGYSRLLQALCEEVDVKAYIIQGYSKGYGYKPGNRFTVSDHSWNAVKLDGSWYLLDVTWAAPRSNHPDFTNGDAVRDKYFLTPPEKFVYNHLPDDPIWQLLENPIALKIFEKGEPEIALHLESAPASFNYRDSIAAYEALDYSKKQIARHLRASKFNPRNKTARYNLGVSVFFDALEAMEKLHALNQSDIPHKIQEMEGKIFTQLDEAAFHFAGIPQGAQAYQEAQHLLEEVTYQKGVFKYEAGQRIMDILWAMDKEIFENYTNEWNAMIGNYFDDATSYFYLINPSSRYYDKAMEYVNDYIKQYQSN